MKKLNNTGLILIIAGVILAAAVLGFSGGNMYSLKLNKTVQKQEILGNIVKDIYIKTVNDTVRIKPSADGDIHIKYSESEDRKYKFNESEVISLEETYDWNLFRIGDLLDLLSEEQSNVILEIPDGYKNSIKVKGTNGTVSADNVSLKNISISTSNGSTELTGLSVETLDISSNNGDIKLNNIISKGDVIFKNKNGGINIENCKIEGSYKSEQSNGSTEFNGLYIGKNTDISLKTGGVKGKFVNPINDFTIESKSSLGNNNLPPAAVYGQKILKVKSNLGNIDITFSK